MKGPSAPGSRLPLRSWKRALGEAPFLTSSLLSAGIQCLHRMDITILTEALRTSSVLGLPQSCGPNGVHPMPEEAQRRIVFRGKDIKRPIKLTQPAYINGRGGTSLINREGFAELERQTIKSRNGLAPPGSCDPAPVRGQQRLRAPPSDRERRVILRRRRSRRP
jgi:hypothetical protein